MVDEIMEQMIHHGLEDSETVSHAIEHNCGFKDTAVSGKGSFPAVLFEDLKVVVTVVEVQLGEELGTLETVDEVRDKRKRVSIADCLGIDVVVVLDYTFGAIFLGDKEDR